MLSQAHVLGIDPGWVTTGLGFWTTRGVFVSSLFMSPREEGGIYKFIQALEKHLHGINVVEVHIERYVAYEGIHNSASEDILMVIGALVYFFENHGIRVVLKRAIDWKPKLCKHLFKTLAFRNPSSSFDKKYSLAAAKALTGRTNITDHEADAICIGYPISTTS